MALIKKSKEDFNPQNAIPKYKKEHVYHQFWTAWKPMMDHHQRWMTPVHPPWFDFLTFADWAKDQDNAWAMYPDGPIDFQRKDPSQGWFPGNCHFVRMSYEEREKRDIEKRCGRKGII